MKIAVCAERDDTASLVPNKFRDTEFVMIIETENHHMVHVYPREDMENIGLAERVVEENCEVLICGELEKAPFEKIAGAGITRYDGAGKKVQRAYDYMLRGKLSVIRDHIGGAGVGHTHDYSCDCGEGHEEDEDLEPVFDAVICAAGRSFRMGDFKPLMEIGGEKMILREIRMLKEAGVRRIIVIGGHRIEDLTSALAENPSCEEVRVVSNSDYASTGLLESVRLGLKEACKADVLPDGIFVGPVDVPLYTAFTLDSLKDRFSMHEEDVYIPEFRGKGGHPMLIRTSSVGKMMTGDESEGLRSVFRQPEVCVCRVDVPDPAVVLDADTTEDLAALRTEWEQRKAPTDERCLSLLHWVGTDESIIDHCLAVAKCTDEITSAVLPYAKDNHIPLHPERIHSAAMLHDILKGMNRHAAAGAELLSSLGMKEVGELILTHDSLPEESLVEINDALILYLADKLVKGTERVSLAERFAEKEQEFNGNKAACKGIARRREAAERALRIAENAGFHRR